LSLPEFQLLRPRTIEEAVAHLAQYDGEIQIAAGGTDLVPSLKQRLFAPKYLLDLRRVSELRGISESGDSGLDIGAMTSLTAIEHSAVIRQRYPVLAQAAATVASPVLRNMGTMGGNICLDTRCLWYNQSLTWRKSCGFCIKKDGDLCHVAPGGSKCWAAFSGDTPPALLCLSAEIEITGPGGKRRVALKDFYTNDGVAQMNLARNELLTRVLLPASSAGYRGAYKKLRLRGSIDYPLAGVAVVVKRTNGHVEDARVAITAVNPAPLLVPGAGNALIGNVLTEEAASAVGDLAANISKPLTTSALTPEYRREMIRVFTKRLVLSLQ
jgi:4-hydroxybenzoyl-CoA reductase subunit beta